MSFVLVIYALLLIALTMITYKKAVLVICVILLLLSATGTLLFYGLYVFELQDLWHVFGKDIDRPTFLHLMMALFAFNIISSFFIVRGYLEYRKVNKL